MRNIFTTIFILSLLLLAPFAVTAITTAAPSSDLSLLDTINNIVKWLITFLVITAVIAIVIAGFYFVTSEGDVEKVKKAKNFLIYALIGVAIGLLARPLVDLVKYIVGDAK